jgi:protein-S-isoprenylcysteine O-methyltransferase Ste14
MTGPGVRDLWRGGRGEYWVLIQFALMAGYVFIPARAAPGPLPTSSFLIALGLVLGSLGLLFLLVGFKTLGRSLTPLPRPKEDGELVRSGIYAVVRHPIYTGVILLALAWAVYLWSGPHLVGSLVLFLFFDAKSRREERWLAAKFPEYAAYARRVKRLLPFVY